MRFNGHINDWWDLRWPWLCHKLPMIHGAVCWGKSSPETMGFPWFSHQIHEGLSGEHFPWKKSMDHDWAWCWHTTYKKWNDDWQIENMAVRFYHGSHVLTSREASVQGLSWWTNSNFRIWLYMVLINIVCIGIINQQTELGRPTLQLCQRHTCNLANFGAPSNYQIQYVRYGFNPHSCLFNPMRARAVALTSGYI